MGLPVELVPESLMYPQRSNDMIAWLIKQPMTREDKVRVLHWWARWVGLRLRGSDYTKVYNSGN